nr:AbrB family transcriptional regulator [Acuticoccus mangrovi]
MTPHAVVCFILSIAAGILAHIVRMPLAFVLGPMIVTAIFAISGITPFAPPPGRRVGQIIVGTSVGLSFTAPVLASLLDYVPLIVFSALSAMLLGAILSIPYARIARVDSKTAYFAMMPGGLAEMANIGGAHGGKSAPISLAQALRVALVVCILPPLIVSLDLHGDFEAFDSVPLVDPVLLIPLFAAAGVGVFTIRTLRLNNPWMVGALLGSATVGVLGLIEGRVPHVLFYAGQFLIGISIGARFKRELVRHLVRLAITSVGFTLVMTAALLAFAFLVAKLGGLDYASAALAVSPGGFAEMTVTAQTLHLNVALVVAFHIVRSVLVNSFSTHLMTMLTHLGLFRLGDRAVQRKNLA